MDSVLKLSLEYVLGADKAIVFPSDSNPKLLIPLVSPIVRWQLSHGYPAFKIWSKPWRIIQRCRSVTGLAKRLNTSTSQSVEYYISDALPGVTHSSVLIGTPGPSRKIIVLLWRKSKLSGFLKVATTQNAENKINHEADILRKLHSVSIKKNAEGLRQTIAPCLLHNTSLNGHASILITPVKGRMLKAHLKEKDETIFLLSKYLRKLEISEFIYTIEDHPAIKRIMRQLNKLQHNSLLPSVREFENRLASLRSLKWPLVIQHGDFTPWNLIINRQHICAIDWEEGTFEGFPCFDIVYYILQTAFLVHGWSALRSFHYAQLRVAEYLSTRETSRLFSCNAKNIAASIVSIAALDSFVRNCDSAPSERFLQLQTYRLQIFNLHGAF